MPWPDEELKARFSRPENEALLRYLDEQSPSAHSDLGILLYEAAKELPGTAVFGPDPTACSYVFLHTDEGVAFALASGMTILAFRLAGPRRDAALAAGARPMAELGDAWVKIDPFDASRSQAAAKALLRKLFQEAHLGASGGRE